MKHKKYSDYDMLYISFVDLDSNATTGSHLRPQQMYRAFEEIGCKIKVLDGENNKIKERRRKVNKTILWLLKNKPRFCYIEPPSGPFFCIEDILLLLELRFFKVPTGIFYRDVYWKYPNMMFGDSFFDTIKRQVIIFMQKIDLFFMKRCCTHFFFPSDSMGEMFGGIKHKSSLPPGCELKNVKSDIGFISEDKELTYIYVGGASERYGVDLIIESFKELNKNINISNLILICPENQWIKNYSDHINQFDYPWLSVIHANGPELDKYYKQADISIIPLLKTEYNDFAVAIKNFEYVSYLKPILSTNCNETKNIILNGNIGWVTNDNYLDFSKTLLYINSHREEIIKFKNNCEKFRNENTWEKRAETVINVLLGRVKTG